MKEITEKFLAHSILPTYTYTYLRQAIILYNLANQSTFVFGLDIDHCQVKERYLP